MSVSSDNLLKKISSNANAFLGSPLGFVTVLTTIVVWNVATLMLYGLQSALSQFGASLSVLSLSLLKRKQNASANAVHEKLDSILNRKNEN